MLLAIDAGNTNVTFALCQDGKVCWHWRIATDARRTADEYAVWLNQLIEMEGLQRGDISAVIIATVVPQALFSLVRLSRRYAGVEPMVVGSDGIDYGMVIDLPNPGEVGADRVVNAVGARSQWPGKLIVLDFGTATTFDVVTAEGHYAGGVIAPGINLSMDALYRAAARLPRIGVEPPPPGLGVIGKGTVHAMQSGVFWGYVGLIEGVVSRIRAELDNEATVIATGGLAPLFSNHTPLIAHVDGDLMVKGLMQIYARNCK